MAKKNHSRQVHVQYSKKFVDHWKEQPQIMKDRCAALGKSHGFSGMNVFYFFVMSYLTRRGVKQPFRPVEKGA